MNDKCYFCKGRLVQEQVTIDYRWGDDLFVIRNVPATLCLQCGEKYLSSPTYKELEKIVKKKNAVIHKINVDVFNFDLMVPA